MTFLIIFQLTQTLRHVQSYPQVSRHHLLCINFNCNINLLSRYLDPMTKLHYSRLRNFEDYRHVKKKYFKLSKISSSTDSHLINLLYFPPVSLSTMRNKYIISKLTSFEVDLVKMWIFKHSLTYKNINFVWFKLMPNTLYVYACICTILHSSFESLY